MKWLTEKEKERENRNNKKGRRENVDEIRLNRRSEFQITITILYYILYYIISKRAIIHIFLFLFVHYIDTIHKKIRFCSFIE